MKSTLVLANLITILSTCAVLALVGWLIGS